MEITWLGHSCFRIRGKEVTIVTDPYDRSLGYSIGKIAANIVTVSHHHPDHDCVAAVGGKPKIVEGPGEYEISDVIITGISSFHDDQRGAIRGKNTAYLIELDEVTVCHLGDLGHVPSSEQVEEMSDVDVLLTPVGGVSTINAATAAETVSLVQPKIVIPMHFKTEVVRRELEPLDRFLKEMGLKTVTPQPKLTVIKTSLPTQTQVVVLDYRR
ncbi:MAG: lactamase [Chloroflexi bacterium RBG_13_54_9]|nr:MAG: lactamase [Chloroflexi bacterium RBG_13_54_9]